VASTWLEDGVWTDLDARSGGAYRCGNRGRGRGLRGWGS